MADKKISALTASTTPLAGTEVLPIVQSGTTVKVSVANLTAGRPIDTTGVVFGNGSFAASKIYASDANGLIIAGKYGTTNDLLVTDPGGNTVLNIPTLTKNLRLADGNLVIGTSGKGIDFTQDPNPAGMTSELLDDYEEGTWTPEFATTGTQFDSITYAAVTGGKYIKIGTQVFIQGVLRTDAVTVGSASGSVIITGLPFIVSTNTGSTANGNSAISIALSASFLANTPTHGALGANTSQISLYSNIAGGSVAPLSMGTGASANSFRFCGTYVTN